jgi:hypothetical protein
LLTAALSLYCKKIIDNRLEWVAEMLQRPIRKERRYIKSLNPALPLPIKAFSTIVHNFRENLIPLT